MLLLSRHHDKCLNTMEQKQVFNLEFRHANELKIGGYNFHKTEEYNEVFRRLAHHVHRVGTSETEVKPQTGTHQITTVVDIPDAEENAALPWAREGERALADVLLLLTLFTGRDVFIKDWEGDLPIIADPRLHQWGAQFRLAPTFEEAWRNKDTGAIVTKKPTEYELSFDYIDIGFEKAINAVLNTIRSPEWQELYDGGYFIFLYRDMVKRQIIEKSFLTCWTIWEQIFALHNKKWLPDEDIYRLGGDKKTAFILSQYFGIKISENAKKSLNRLARSRNRLVHFGKKMENVDNSEKEMFIRLTEQLLTMTLGLRLNNSLNSLERLAEFLEK